MKNYLKYILLGIVFWFVIDFTTTEAIRNPAGYFSTYMPLLLVFYIGYPLVFSLLIYKFKLKDRGIFIGALIGAFVVEILFTQNALLFTFPIMLFAIPLAVAIYSLLTLVPKWIVEGEVKKNKKKTIFLVVVWILLAILTFMSH